MTCIYFNFDKKQLLFLAFIVFSFLKKLNRKWKESNNDLAHRLLNIYLFILGDLLCYIPLYISSKNSKIENTEKKVNKKNNITKKPTSISLELIYHNEVEERHDYKLKKVFIISIFDLIAQISLFIFYLIRGNIQKVFEDLSIFLIFNIVSKYILSRIILKTYFYCHHYFSLFINLFILIILGIVDLMVIKEQKGEDNENILIKILYILIKIISIIFYSLENVYGKKALTTEFLSPYSLLTHKGIYEFIIVFILSIPLLFFKVNNEDKSQSIIFSKIGSIFTDFTNVLGVLSLLIVNIFYNILIWTIIDKFSPSHLAMANIFESFGNLLCVIILNKKDNNENWIIYIIYFVIYIFLFIGASIHNEICVIKLCGLHEKTKSFLEEKALLDLPKKNVPFSDASCINEEEDDDDNDKSNSIEMKEKFSF